MSPGNIDGLIGACVHSCIYTCKQTHTVQWDILWENLSVNFVDTLQFVTIFSHKHFALVKLHSSLSMVVVTSTIPAISEAVRKTIENNTDPGVKKTLIILVNQIHLSIGHFMT